MPYPFMAKCSVILFAAWTLCASASQAFASGVDTPVGVDNLPLNVEGVMGMTLYNTSNSPAGPVYVGVGTVAPQYPLTVNGVVALATNSGGVLLTPGATYGNPAIQAITSVGTANPLLINPGGGDVEIGMSGSPEAALDVNGGVLATNAAIVAGQTCLQEGMIGYDMTNHDPVYCSNSTNPASWKSVTAATWQNDTSSNGTPFNQNCQYRVTIKSAPGICNNVIGSGPNYVNSVVTTYLTWSQNTYQMIVYDSNRGNVEVILDQVGSQGYCALSSLQMLCQ